MAKQTREPRTKAGRKAAKYDPYWLDTILAIEAEAAAPTSPDVVERLAAIEHEQWAHWTRYMLDSLTPENIERWRRQINTPYSALTEREKDSDRQWARKVLAALPADKPEHSRRPA